MFITAEDRFYADVGERYYAVRDVEHFTKGKTCKLLGYSENLVFPFYVKMEDGMCTSISALCTIDKDLLSFEELFELWRVKPYMVVYVVPLDAYATISGFDMRTRKMVILGKDCYIVEDLRDEYKRYFSHNVLTI